jgi:hypothetical protein
LIELVSDDLDVVNPLEHRSSPLSDNRDHSRPALAKRLIAPEKPLRAAGWSGGLP